MFILLRKIQLASLLSKSNLVKAQCVKYFLHMTNKKQTDAITPAESSK